MGNSAFAANKLKDAIKTGQTNFLSFLLNNDFYDPDKVEIDRDLLSRFYRAHGYPDIHVVSAAPRYDAAKKGLVLTFTLDEGPRYRFGTVIIKSGVNAVGSNTLTQPG
jgi:outer membrane protein insertion porin family